MQPQMVVSIAKVVASLLLAQSWAHARRSLNLTAQRVELAIAAIAATNQVDGKLRRKPQPCLPTQAQCKVNIAVRQQLVLQATLLYCNIHNIGV